MPSKKLRTIKWRLHLRSSPKSVFQMLTTDKGRERFWAEKSKEKDRVIRFTFPEGSTLAARVIEKAPPKRFVLEYFGGSVVTFDLKSDGENGTDLALSGKKVKYYEEELPGWVSVLLALKAALDFSVDLRNHDPERAWNKGYIDN